MYKIANMTVLAKTLGKTVAKDADFTYDQLRDYISVQNIKNIIKDYADKDEDGCRAISSEGVASAMSDIFDWLLGRDLATMCANDELDCYWDDNINEMVFKAKEEKKTIEETYSKRTRPRRPNE